MSPYSEQRQRVKVSSFLEAGAGPLDMELVAGKGGIKHVIAEAAINRPGLALSGFYKYFPHRRIQVIGLSEYSYLDSLGTDERHKSLRDFFAHKIPCVVFSRHKKVPDEAFELAEEFNVPILRSQMITKHFINAATIIMENLMAPRLKVQGTMVEIQGVGVLIKGDPGVGKSETALGLIKRGHALVADDVTSLRRDSAGSLIGGPVFATRYHMEIRGLGIIHVPSLFGVTSVREDKKLDLVVTLFDAGKAGASDDLRGSEARQVTSLLGVELPHLLLRVAAGRDMVNIVETAALDAKLRRLGHDAVKELDERLIGLMTGAQVVSE